MARRQLISLFWLFFLCPAVQLSNIALHYALAGYRLSIYANACQHSAFLLPPRTPLCKYFERNRDRHLRNSSVRSAAIYKRRRYTKAASLIKKSFKVCRISCFCFHSSIFLPVFFLHICRVECNYLVYYNEFLIRFVSIS